jgi:hypothetical protein
LVPYRRQSRRRWIVSLRPSPDRKPAAKGETQTSEGVLSLHLALRQSSSNIVPRRQQNFGCRTFRIDRRTGILPALYSVSKLLSTGKQ